MDSMQSIQIAMSLENRNKYSARNPAVKVNMDPDYARASGSRPEWYWPPDRTWAQWDGGQVHGTWTRQIPFFELVELGLAREEPYGFPCEAVAEGFRRDFVLWIKYQASR
jgi:hypothetical protein